MRPTEVATRVLEGLGRSMPKHRKAQERSLEEQIGDLEEQIPVEIRRLVPKCRDCGGGNIRLKLSSRLVDPGNDIVGPAGRGPTFATYVNFLHCEDCGGTYYTSKVDKIQGILSQIKQLQKKVARSKRIC